MALAPPHANQAKQVSKLWPPTARHGKGSASRCTGGTVLSKIYARLEYTSDVIVSHNDDTGLAYSTHGNDELGNAFAES